MVGNLIYNYKLELKRGRNQTAINIDPIQGGKASLKFVMLCCAEEVKLGDKREPSYRKLIRVILASLDKIYIQALPYCYTGYGKTLTGKLFDHWYFVLFMTQTTPSKNSSTKLITLWFLRLPQNQSIIDLVEEFFDGLVWVIKRTKYQWSKSFPVKVLP